MEDPDKASLTKIFKKKTVYESNGVLPVANQLYAQPFLDYVLILLLPTPKNKEVKRRKKSKIKVSLVLQHIDLNIYVALLPKHLLKILDRKCTNS